jgi:predicted membrane chloride channel (bestrophin family)
MELERAVHEIYDIVHETFASETGRLDGANGPAGARLRQLGHGLQVEWRNGAVEAYLSETLTPSLTSLAASSCRPCRKRPRHSPWACL